jgi:PD-(D/E)XK endonuclease
MPNTKLIGEISEAIVLVEFLKAGFPVALPFGDNQRYDIVVEVGGSFLRVQCKTARVIKGGAVVCFNARSTNPPERSTLSSYRNQADLFAAYSPHTKQVYVLPVDEVPETDVWMRLLPVRNNQRLRIRWAKDCTLEAWVARITSGERRPASGSVTPE